MATGGCTSAAVWARVRVSPPSGELSQQQVGRQGVAADDSQGSLLLVAVKCLSCTGSSGLVGGTMRMNNNGTSVSPELERGGCDWDGARG